MRIVAAAGEGAANDGLRHFRHRSASKSGSRCAAFCPLFLSLGLGDVLYLFLHSGKQGNLPENRFFGRKNGGFFARRFLYCLLYL